MQIPPLAEAALGLHVGGGLEGDHHDIRGRPGFDATELQADCYAGIWARQAQERFGTLDVGDMEEAMRAAEAVGDDVIQANAGRTPMPDSFTHGSAAQRQSWLMRGFNSGELRQCDTFSAGNP